MVAMLQKPTNQQIKYVSEAFICLTNREILPTSHIRPTYHHQLLSLALAVAQLQPCTSPTKIYSTTLTMSPFRSTQVLTATPPPKHFGPNPSLQRMTQQSPSRMQLHPPLPSIEELDNNTKWLTNYYHTLVCNYVPTLNPGWKLYKTWQTPELSKELAQITQLEKLARNTQESCSPNPNIIKAHEVASNYWRNTVYIAQHTFPIYCLQPTSNNTIWKAAKRALPVQARHILSISGKTTFPEQYIRFYSAFFSPVPISNILPSNHQPRTFYLFQQKQTPQISRKHQTVTTSNTLILIDYPTILLRQHIKSTPFP